MSEEGDGYRQEIKENVSISCLQYMNVFSSSLYFKHEVQHMLFVF